MYWLSGTYPGIAVSGLDTQALIARARALALPISLSLSLLAFSGTTNAFLRGPERPNFDVEPHELHQQT